MTFQGLALFSQILDCQKFDSQEFDIHKNYMQNCEIMSRIKIKRQKLTI